MPWCPHCRIEYVAGKTKCRDCGVALVEDIALTEAERKQLLSKEQRKRRVPDRKGREVPSVISNGEYRSITEARAAYVTDRIEFAYITSMLDEAGIRYRAAAEDAGQYLQIVHGRSYIGSIIYVGADDLEEAKRIAQSYSGRLQSAEDEAPPEDLGDGVLSGIGIARGCLILNLFVRVGFIAVFDIVIILA